MKKYYLIVLVFLLLMGCSNHKIPFENYKTKKLNVIPIDLPSDCLLRPFKFHLFDSLLLIEDEYDGKGISVIDLKSKKLVKRILSLGKGPNEVEHLFTFTKIGEKFFQIGDPNQRKSLIFSIDSIYNQNAFNAVETINWRNFQLKKDQSLIKLYKVNDRLYTGLGQFSSTQHIIIHKKNNELNDYIVDYKYNYPITDRKGNRIQGNYSEYNIFEGEVSISPNKKFMVYSCLNCFYYRIFNIGERSITKSFERIDKFPEVQMSSRSNRLRISDENKGGLRSPYATNEAFYVLHLNHSVKEMTNYYCHLTYEMFKIGWDGKIQNKFVLDKYIMDMAIDERNNKVYVIYFDFKSFTHGLGYFNF